MLLPIVQHVTALAEGHKVMRPVVRRIVVAVRCGQDHADRGDQSQFCALRLAETPFAWLAMPLNDCCKFARHAPTRDQGVRDRAQALLDHVINDVEDAEAPAVGELVMDEVGGPARVRSGFDQDRRACAHSLASGPPLAHGQPFLAVESMDTVDARGLALASEDEQPPTAQPPSFVGQLAQPGANFGIRRPAWFSRQGCRSARSTSCCAGRSGRDLTGTVSESFIGSTSGQREHLAVSLRSQQMRSDEAIRS